MVKLSSKDVRIDVDTAYIGNKQLNYVKVIYLANGIYAVEHSFGSQVDALGKAMEKLGSILEYLGIDLEEGEVL